MRKNKKKRSPQLRGAEMLSDKLVAEVTNMDGGLVDELYKGISTESPVKRVQHLARIAVWHHGEKGVPEHVVYPKNLVAFDF